jgi:hypothetical protein
VTPSGIRHRLRQRPSPPSRSPRAWPRDAGTAAPPPRPRRSVERASSSRRPRRGDAAECAAIRTIAWEPCDDGVGEARERPGRWALRRRRPGTVRSRRTRHEGFVAAVGASPGIPGAGRGRQERNRTSRGRVLAPGGAGTRPRPHSPGRLPHGRQRTLAACQRRSFEPASAPLGRDRPGGRDVGRLRPDGQAWVGPVIGRTQSPDAPVASRPMPTWRSTTLAVSRSSPSRAPARGRRDGRPHEAGGPYPHDQDGVVFENREGLLPTP